MEILLAGMPRSWQSTTGGASTDREFVAEPKHELAVSVNIAAAPTAPTANWFLRLPTGDSPFAPPRVVALKTLIRPGMQSKQP